MLMPGGSYSALGSGGQASMPHALLPNPPKTLQRDKSKLRVAHFVTMTGTAGIWGPSSVNCAVLAAHQINARGGILGREVELSVIDTGAEIEDVTRDAEDIVESDGADVIVGNHISAIRMSLRKTFAGHLPYIYPSIYEGGERTPGLFAIGETPPRQARPAIAWLAERKRAQRWYLIGSDYVWPWLSHREVKSYIAETGGRVVGEDFVPLGDPDHHRYVERIRALQPDVVFISLIGLDGILFNRMFAEYGLSEKVLRLANCIDENRPVGDRCGEHDEPVRGLRLLCQREDHVQRSIPHGLPEGVRRQRADSGRRRTGKLRSAVLPGGAGTQIRDAAPAQPDGQRVEHRLSRGTGAGRGSPTSRRDADLLRRGRWLRLSIARKVLTLARRTETI
jgi:hypothetical protein